MPANGGDGGEEKGPPSPQNPQSGEDASDEDLSLVPAVDLVATSVPAREERVTVPASALPVRVTPKAVDRVTSEQTRIFKERLRNLELPALQVLWNIARNPNAHAPSRVVAARTILEYSRGKPKENGTKVLDALTPQELTTLAEAIILRRATAKGVVDAQLDGDGE